MFKNKTKILGLIILLLGLLIGFQNCEWKIGPDENRGGSEGTSTGDPSKALRFIAYDEVEDEDGGLVDVNNLKMCFKEMRFFGVDDTPDVIVYPGELAISPQGSLFKGFNIPLGHYNRVVFDLDGLNCQSGISLSFSNSGGAYQTTNQLYLEFEGDVNLTAEKKAVWFYLDDLVVVMDDINNDAQIKTLLEEIISFYE